ncbi:amiloride-sensitive sodium channel subunit gamma [Plakobranchus ocellatus]|uniref:Amiloride-sensitive sodium channel subunit gamma n=1 Tax=Plakobranchus ocellatus TaxID=259542 RepID=A0AAV3ZTP4_9GAST|nr:amiloride-sensitive sodium channel subunit gamma [Plakobranchus ocellatus]
MTIKKNSNVTAISDSILDGNITTGKTANRSTFSNKEDEVKATELVQNFAQSTSMHGVSRAIGQGPLWRKALWSSLVLGFAVWAVFNVTQIITDYQSHPVATAVSSEYNSELQFPAVTFCNLNRMRLSAATDYILNTIQEYSDLGYNSDYINRILNLALRTYDQDQQISMGHTIEDMLIRCNFNQEKCSGLNFTHSFSLQHGNCYTFASFQDKSREKWVCSSSPTTSSSSSSFFFVVVLFFLILFLIFWLLLLYFLILFRLHFFLRTPPHFPLSSSYSFFSRHIDGATVSESTIKQPSWVRTLDGQRSGMKSSRIPCCGEALTTVKAGPLHGLVLELDVQLHEYLNTTPVGGVKILVHGNREMPFLEDAGVSVAPGLYTSIGIRKVGMVTKTDINRLAHPYGTCLTLEGSIEENKNMFSQMGFDYSDSACQKTCFQQSVYNACRCCESSLPCIDDALMKVTGHFINGVIPYCNTLIPEIDDCVYEIESAFTTNKLGCAKACPPSCKQATFATTISTGLWPTPAYKNLMLKRRDLDLNNLSTQSILRMEIFYESLILEKVESSPAYTWYKLLGDIGGQLGLLLGFSILTAMEILELLLVDLGFGLGFRTFCRRDLSQFEGAKDGVRAAWS